MTNRFKGLDLIDRVPEELWTEVRDIVQKAGIKTIPNENKCKKAKARDQIANICWIMEKEREFQKNIYFFFITMPKPLTVWITINCGKF